MLSGGREMPSSGPGTRGGREGGVSSPQHLRAELLERNEDTVQMQVTRQACGSAGWKKGRGALRTLRFF